MLQGASGTLQGISRDFKGVPGMSTGFQGILEDFSNVPETSGVFQGVSRTFQRFQWHSKAGVLREQGCHIYRFIMG